ncbi:MAG: hypothetical protein HRU28_07890 [Rhizobiales bacterium]|nr:hypothetical protein [Hyphomicrobiales bacterium]
MNKNESQFLADDLYLAVDGGGTSCKTRLYNNDGTMLGEGKAGASNARLGAKRVLNEILLSAKLSFLAAGIDFSNISKTHACFGLAGLELKRDQELFDALDTDFKSVILETDGVTACMGALGGAEGAVIVTGTGTSAIALHHKNIHNIGGWGFEVSDGGGGAILGRHAVRHTLRSAEALENKTDLTKYIMQYFDNKITNMILWAEQAEPKDYGFFAAKVFDLADQGDKAAIFLLGRHMQALVQLIDGIMSCGVERFTLIGGLADRSLALLPERLKTQYVKCQNDALYGGFLRIRRELSGSRVTVPQKFNNITTTNITKESSK